MTRKAQEPLGPTRPRSGTAGQFSRLPSAISAWHVCLNRPVVMA